MSLTQSLSDALAVLGENYMRLTPEKQNLLQGFALMVALYAVVVSSAKFISAKRRKSMTVEDLANVVITQPIGVGTGRIKDDGRLKKRELEETVREKVTGWSMPKETPDVSLARSYAESIRTQRMIEKISQIADAEKTAKAKPQNQAEKPKIATSEPWSGAKPIFTPKIEAPPHAVAPSNAPVKSRPTPAKLIKPTPAPAKGAQGGVYSALKAAIMPNRANLRLQKDETRQKTQVQEPVERQPPTQIAEAEPVRERSSALKLPAGITDAVVEIDFIKALTKQEALDLQLCFGFIYVDEDKYDEARECLKSKELINFLVPKQPEAADEIYPSLSLAKRLNAILLTNSRSLADTCRRNGIICWSMDSWKSMPGEVPA